MSSQWDNANGQSSSAIFLSAYNSADDASIFISDLIGSQQSTTEEPMYFGAQFDTTTFDTTTPDYFPSTYTRLFSPVTVTIDTIRKITKSITNSSDTQRLVSSLVSTTSDTLRQVMAGSIVTVAVDTIRRVFVSNSGQADSKRKITNTDIIKGDTKRSVWLRVQSAVDSVRSLTNSITNTTDTLRQIVNLHVTVAPFDTLRKVVNSQFVRVDTKRSAWKQVQTWADTLRKFFTGGAWPVSLEIAMTPSRVDLGVTPRIVRLEVDGQVQNIVVTAGNLVELKATFYDKETGQPADPAGTVKFTIYDSRKRELQSFALSSGNKKADGVYAMEYPTPKEGHSFLYFEASSTLGEMVEVERGGIQLRWAS